MNLTAIEMDWVEREAKAVNAELATLDTVEAKVNHLKEYLRRNVLPAPGAEVIPLHQNSIQTVASFVRRLDRGTIFAAGMLFSLSIVTFFAARR